MMVWSVRSWAANFTLISLVAALFVDNVSADGTVSLVVEEGFATTFTHDVRLFLGTENILYPENYQKENWKGGKDENQDFHKRNDTMGVLLQMEDRQILAEAAANLMKNTEESDQGIHLGTMAVTVARLNKETLLLMVKTELQSNASLLSGGPVEALITTPSGGDVILSTRSQLPSGDVNYLRALASALSPIQGDHSYHFHIQNDIFGSCEITYSREGDHTLASRDLQRCTGFAVETTLGLHTLPLLHVGMELAGSTSTCDYHWTTGDALGNVESLLQDVQCRDMLLLSPRLSSAGDALNITTTSDLTLNRVTKLTQEHRDVANRNYVETPMLLQPPVLKDRACDGVAEKMAVICSIVSPSSGGDGEDALRLLQEVAALTPRLACSPPLDMRAMPAQCPSETKSALALTAAMAGGPRMLAIVYYSLSDIVRSATTDPGVHTALPLAFFRLADHDALTLPHFYSDPGNVKLYTQMARFLGREAARPGGLGSQAVGALASLLEGLRRTALPLFRSLLQEVAEVLSPEQSCGSPNHQETARLLGVLSVLQERPAGFVKSLRQCFTTDSVLVQAAAMDSLATLTCREEDVAELQRLVLESPSDPEIRVAAYRGLAPCLPARPTLLSAVTRALDTSHLAYSPQVASYIWSHTQSVLSGDDTSQLPLRDQLLQMPDITDVPDPVWYDPRRHSRYFSRTLHLSARTSLTLVGELVWGRSSPAPRTARMGVVINRNGIRYDVLQASVRVSGLEGVVFRAFAPAWERALGDGWVLVQRLVEALRDTHRHKRDEDQGRHKREEEEGGEPKDGESLNQEDLREFIKTVLSSMPSEYKSSTAHASVRLSALGRPLLHRDFTLAELHRLPRLLAMHARHTTNLLLPLLDSTLSLSTSSGAPLLVRLTSTAVLDLLLDHSSLPGSTDDTTALSLRVRSGVCSNFEVSFPSQGLKLVSSETTRVLNLPLSLSYRVESSGTVTMRLPPPPSSGLLLWATNTTTTFRGHPTNARPRTEQCLGSNDAVSLCLVYSEDDASMSVPSTGVQLGSDPSLSATTRTRTLPWLRGQELSVLLLAPSVNGPVDLTYVTSTGAGSRWQVRVHHPSPGGSTARYSATLTVELNSALFSIDGRVSTPWHRREAGLSLGISGTTVDGSLTYSLDSDRYMVEVTVLSESAGDSYSQWSNPQDSNNLRFLSEGVSPNERYGGKRPLGDVENRAAQTRPRRRERRAMSIRNKVTRRHHRMQMNNENNPIQNHDNTNVYPQSAGGIDEQGETNSTMLKGYLKTEQNKRFPRQIVSPPREFDPLIDDNFRRQIAVANPTAGQPKIWSVTVAVTTPAGGKKELGVGEVVRVGGREYGVDELLLLLKTGDLLQDYVTFNIEAEVTHSTERGSLNSCLIKNATVVIPGYGRLDARGAINRVTPLADFQLQLDWLSVGQLEIFSSLSTETPSSIHLPPEVEAALATTSLAASVSVWGRNMESPVVVALDAVKKISEVSGGMAIEHGVRLVRLQQRYSWGDLGQVSSAVTVRTSEESHVLRGEQHLEWGPEGLMGGLRYGLNCSWSPAVEDSAALLLHISNDWPVSASMMMMVEVGLQRVEVEQRLEEGTAGSLKHHVAVRLDPPGRTVAADTVILYRIDAESFSAGVSNDLSVEGWDSNLRTVASANCLRGWLSCSAMGSSERGGDQLLDIDIKYNGARGVSRTDFRLVVLDELETEGVVDVAQAVGVGQVRWQGRVHRGDHYINGRLNLNVMQEEVATLEVRGTRPPLAGGVEGELTHYLNASATVNTDTRSLYSRHELRVLGDDGRVLLWAGAVQGRLGRTVLQDKHLAKVTVTTPDGGYYFVSSEASSAQEDDEVQGAVSLMASLRQNSIYYFNSHYSHILTYHDHLPELPNGLSIDASVKTGGPGLGELKFTAKGKQQQEWPPDSSVEERVNTTVAEMRVSTSKSPVLVGLRSQYIASPVEYSLATRAWTTEDRALVFESYRIRANHSDKSSHRMVAMDPRTSWHSAGLTFEVDKIGVFPRDFQTSYTLVSTKSHLDTIQAQFLTQRTPSISTFSVTLPPLPRIQLPYDFIQLLNKLPAPSMFWAKPAWLTTTGGENSKFIFHGIQGGKLLIQLRGSSAEGSVSWGEVRGAVLCKWVAEGGSGTPSSSYSSLSAHYLHPGAEVLSALDAAFKLNSECLLGQSTSHALQGRLSINSRQHWVMKGLWLPQEEQYSAEAAVVGSSSSAFVSTALARTSEEEYEGRAALVLGSFTANVLAKRMLLFPGDRLEARITCSLLSDPAGVTLRAWRLPDNQQPDLGLEISHGQHPPDWRLSYRLVSRLERADGPSLQLSVSDLYERLGKEVLLDRRSFFRALFTFAPESLDIQCDIPEVLGDVPKWLGLPSAYWRPWLHGLGVSGRVEWVVRAVAAYGTLTATPLESGHKAGSVTTSNDVAGPVEGAVAAPTRFSLNARVEYVDEALSSPSGGMLSLAREGDEGRSALLEVRGLHSSQPIASVTINKQSHTENGASVSSPPRSLAVKWSSQSRGSTTVTDLTFETDEDLYESELLAEHDRTRVSFEASLTHQEKREPLNAVRRKRNAELSMKNLLTSKIPTDEGGSSNSLFYSAIDNERPNPRHITPVPSGNNSTKSSLIDDPQFRKRASNLGMVKGAQDDQMTFSRVSSSMQKYEFQADDNFSIQENPQENSIKDKILFSKVTSEANNPYKILPFSDYDIDIHVRGSDSYSDKPVLTFHGDQKSHSQSANVKASLAVHSSKDSHFLRDRPQPQSVSRQKQQIFKLKGNVRKIDQELTTSLSLEHFVLERARSVAVQWSPSERYAEVVLDVFELEAHQVLAVATYKPDDVKLSVGQLGNSFLLLGYQATSATSTTDEPITLHRGKAELAGRRLEVWVEGQASRTASSQWCHRFGMVGKTPSISPTHTGLTLCRGAASGQFTMRLLGIETDEGPILSVSFDGSSANGTNTTNDDVASNSTPADDTTSSSAWFTVSLSDGRPSGGLPVLPALSFALARSLPPSSINGSTSLVLELRRKRWKQLLAEVSRRLHLVLGESPRQGPPRGIILQGHLQLELLQEQVVQSGNIILQSIEKLSSNETVSPMSMVHRLWLIRPPFVSTVLEEVHSRVLTPVLLLQEALRARLYRPVQEVTIFRNRIIDTLHNSQVWKLVKLMPHLQASLRQLNLNDQQSVWALVSREGSALRGWVRAGGRPGPVWLLQLDAIARMERTLTLELSVLSLQERGAEALVRLQEGGLLTVTEEEEEGRLLVTVDIPNMVSPTMVGGAWRRVRSWLLSSFGQSLTRKVTLALAKMIHLATRPQGQASLIGWRSAISWDGSLVSPLVGDSCPHMLLLLHRTRPLVAITLEVQEEASTLGQPPVEVRESYGRLLTFVSGEHTVTLDRNLQVTVNGEVRTDSKISISDGDIEIRRDRLTGRDAWSSVTVSIGRAGLTVSCAVVGDSCLLTLEEEQFAASAGLLGVYDMEPNTDVMTGSWGLPGSSDEWSRSWRVTSDARACPELEVEDEEGNTAPSTASCQSLTNDAPVLRNCHDILPPASYRAACQQQPCGAATAYRAACNAFLPGVLSQHLPECEGSGPGPTSSPSPVDPAPPALSERGSSTHAAPPRPITGGSAGETHSPSEGQAGGSRCVGDVPSRMFGTEDLPLEVVVLGDTSCAFSLEPLLEHLLEESSRPVKVSSVVLSDGSLGPLTELSGGVSNWHMSVLDAMRATLLTLFSDAALKTIIVADCGLPGCRQENSLWSSEQLQQQLTQVLQLGVQVHVFTSDELTVTNPQDVSGRNQRRLLGLDSRTSYSTSHARRRRLRGNRDLREDIAPPTGNLCAQMAVQSDGSVWSLPGLQRIKKRSKRSHALALPALRILDSLENPHQECRECPCGNSLCKAPPCSTPCTLCVPPPPRPINEVLNREPTEDLAGEEGEDYD